MPRLTNAVPKYRLHRASGQAIVSFGGQDHYLGPHGTETSKRKYDRLIGEYLSGQRNTAIVNRGFTVSVAELLEAFLDHAEGFYQKNGQPTSELFAYRRIVLTLAELYGADCVTTFGPIALKAVRDKWVRDGFSRSTCNKDQRRITRIWKWGVANEMVGPQYWQSLVAVDGLRKGRTSAPEAKPIMPVEPERIQKTLPHLSPVVAAMVQLQMLTGMRPGEVCNLRPGDIDRSSDVWEYRPGSHKTEHHGRARTVYIGPKARAILGPYLFRGQDEHCFSPVESRQWFRDRATEARKTPPSCGNRVGKRSQPVKKSANSRKPRQFFDSSSYGQAIQYACLKAWPAPKAVKTDPPELKAWIQKHRWAPNQIRHTQATAIRKQFGLEAAQVILGHASADVTQIYAERDADKARDIIRQIG